MLHSYVYSPVTPGYSPSYAPRKAKFCGMHQHHWSSLVAVIALALAIVLTYQRYHIYTMMEVQASSCPSMIMFAKSQNGMYAMAAAWIVVAAAGSHGAYGFYKYRS
jgi:hypothetical protein